MTMPGFIGSKHKQAWLRTWGLGLAGFATLIACSHQAAASDRSERSVMAVESRTAGEPILAIVSLRSQRITVYDANGWILQAPVSSGQKGRETPAGIFSIIQKEAEHYSNLYDDAYMPHMERITWSGIALHGGPLPGYAASHGCIRMPYDFARDLFDETKVGMRVIVAPRDVAPVAIDHPALFQPKPVDSDVAAAKAAEAAQAASTADQAKLAAATAFRDAKAAMMPLRALEKLKLKAEGHVAAAERSVASAGSPEAKEQAEDVKAKAVAELATLEAQWAAAKAEVQPKLDAVAPAREAAVAAEAARVVAAEAAREAARALAPVSVFISRKTQRLYVRQAFRPVLESPVTIRDADQPIGSHVFTAMERTGGGATMRWSVVSLSNGHPDVGGELNDSQHGQRDRDATPPPGEAGAAKEALDRITIPQDVLDRIAAMASPRSSLIISDEPLSGETSTGTDFVVIMSGEPQGGIKFRRRTAPTEVGFDRSRDRLPYWRPPFGGYSDWRNTN